MTTIIMTTMIMTGMVTTLMITIQTSPTSTSTQSSILLSLTFQFLSRTYPVLISKEGSLQGKVTSRHLISLKSPSSQFKLVIRPNRHPSSLQPSKGDQRSLGSTIAVNKGGALKEGKLRLFVSKLALQFMLSSLKNPSGLLVAKLSTPSTARMSKQVSSDQAHHSHTCQSPGRIQNKLHNTLKDLRQGTNSQRINNSQFRSSLVDHNEISTDVSLKLSLDNKNRINMVTNSKNK